MKENFISGPILLLLLLGGLWLLAGAGCEGRAGAVAVGDGDRLEAARNFLRSGEGDEEAKVEGEDAGKALEKVEAELARRPDDVALHRRRLRLLLAGETAETQGRLGAACRGLERIGVAPVVALTAALDWRDQPVARRNAVLALGGLLAPGGEEPGRREAVRGLLRASEDRAAAVREAAVRALGECGATGEGVRFALRMALRDASAEVRGEAALVLGRRGETEAGPELERMTLEAAAGRRREAREMLSQLAGKKE